MQDIISNISVTQVLNPVLSTSARTSSSVDLQGFQTCLLIAHMGQTLDTLNGSNYWTIKVQHSDNNSAWSDTTSTDFKNGNASYVVNSSSLDEAAYTFGYIGTKRYVRLQILNTGTHSSGTPMGATCLRGEASLLPVV